MTDTSGSTPSDPTCTCSTPWRGVSPRAGGPPASWYRMSSAPRARRERTCSGHHPGNRQRGPVKAAAASGLGAGRACVGRHVVIGWVCDHAAHGDALPVSDVPNSTFQPWPYVAPDVHVDAPGTFGALEGPPAVRRAYAQHNEHYLVPLIGDIPLARLRAEHIASVFATIREWNASIEAQRAAGRALIVLDGDVRKVPAGRPRRRAAGDQAPRGQAHGRCAGTGGGR